MKQIDLKYGLSKVGLPLIVTSNTPNLCFLIDTGSTHNVIFSFVAKALNLTPNSLVDVINISGIEGEEQETQGLSYTLHIDEEEIISEFYILDVTQAIRKIQEETGIQIHGILGVPFLDEHNCIVDFNEQILILN